ncbi:MAG: amidophosphoribosyltransferase [bacterium]|nr:amidophosphoribosyltransferase [bacterium]
MSGIAAVHGAINAVRLVQLMSYAQQDRGTASAGIAWFDSRGKILQFKGTGLVNQIFGRRPDFDELEVSTAIGQTRWPTHGAVEYGDAQPIVRLNKYGPFAVASNGNISNADELREKLLGQGACFSTETSDTHIIPTSLAQQGASTFLEAFVETLRGLRGGYALVCLTPIGLILACDPIGYRPLVLGRCRDKGKVATVAASETAALDLIGAEFIRNVEPGEIIVVNDEGIKSHYELGEVNIKRCSVELSSLQQPSSVAFGIAVSRFRDQLGRKLAEEHPIGKNDPDDKLKTVVVPIPDSGNEMALGYAAALNLPIGSGLVRHSHGANRHLPTGSERTQEELSVLRKISVVANVVRDKRVILIHSRILRGRTSRVLIKLITEAGAKEVHLLISVPPTVSTCWSGVGRPSDSVLISTQNSVEDLRIKLGKPKSLHFLSLGGFEEVLDKLGNDCNTFCTSCFTGEYSPGTLPE